jgi:hypothetical protein
MLAACFAGGAFAQSIGGSIIRTGYTMLAPNILYGPVNSNPANSTPTQPGGPLGSTALSINTGTMTIWNNSLYGWGSSAAALCVMTGALGSYPSPAWTQNGNCPISGGLGSNNNGYAIYVERDSAGAFIGNQTLPALFGSINGTFTATTFVPSPALNATQIGNLRVGMPIDTNDATPYSGVVASWAADGSSVTVPAWYTQGTGHAAGTPAGTAATINARSKIFALNTWNQRNSGTDVTQATNTEFDCGNNSGVDDTGIAEVSLAIPYDGCIDLTSLNGANIASFGMTVRGKFNAAISLADTGLYGIDMSLMTITAGGAPIVGQLLTPATSSATCKTGSIEWDTGFIYICTATNTWKRATLATF